VRDGVADHFTGRLGDGNEGAGVVEPRLDVSDGSGLGLEGRDPILDPLVVDFRDRGRVVSTRQPRHQAAYGA
jgi:hypothetical protein